MMKRCRICLCELKGHQSFAQWLHMEELLCDECRSRFPVIHQTLQVKSLKIHAFCLYDSFMEGLLFQLKEGRDIALAPVLFWPFYSYLRRYRGHKWILMPSSDEKSIERGFLPLREMLKYTRMTLYEPFYKKTSFKQAKRSKEERIKIEQEMDLKQEYPLPKGNYLLIDDVCTTSATLQHAYRLLLPHSNKIEAVVLCVHPLLIEQTKTKDHFRRRGITWKEL